MGNILIVVSSNTMLCKIYICCFADFKIKVEFVVLFVFFFFCFIAMFLIVKPCFLSKGFSFCLTPVPFFWENRLICEFLVRSKEP